METTRLILGAGAVTGGICLLVLSLMDSTHAHAKRMDVVAKAASAAPRLQDLTKKASFTSDLDTLVQRPVFAMTTGAGAYAEKAFQLIGISISPERKAALVAIDGAAPVWVRVGQVTGDVQLLDVNASSARFDTPLGERTVNLGEAPPSSSPPATTGG